MAKPDRPPESPSPAVAPERRPSPFQFGVASLLVLTAAVAGVLAILRPLDLPPLAHVALAGYAILIAVYVVFRGFYLWRRLRWARRRLQRQRQELLQWVEGRRRPVPPADADPSDSIPTDDSDAGL